MSATRPTMRVVRTAGAPGASGASGATSPAPAVAAPPARPAAAAKPRGRAAAGRSTGPRRPSPGPATIDHPGVSSLDARRIEYALACRTRYRYVQPRVLREGPGWVVLSPNCSRNVDAQGGEIFIARLVPAAGGAWLLHSRDHAQQRWQLRRQGPLWQLLQALCADPQREYWV